MRLLLTALALSAAAAFSASAAADCECLWRGSFDQVHAEADLIVAGVVIDRNGNSIDLNVDRELRGGQDFDEVRIWLKAGDYCRPEVETFPIGSQWLMALHRIDELVPGGFNPNTPNISYGRVGDYELSVCGGYWLSRAGDWVSGNLVDAPRWVREPEMTPVLLDVIERYVQGDIDKAALLKASQADPAVKQLMLDTKAFLRGQDPSILLED